MVSSKQKSRKMKMGKRTRSKKTNRSRKQRGGQTSTMSESTSSMPELSSSTSTMSESTSSMPELSSSTSTMSASSTSTMPALISSTSTMPASSTSTAASRVSKMPMSSTSTNPPPTSTAPLRKVNVYFKLEGGKPKFISSTDPRITVGDTSIAQAAIKINPSLGKLYDYSGSGWSQANRWVSVHSSKLNKPANALRLSVGDNLVRKIGAPSASILRNQIQLPSLLLGVIAKGLDKATFGIGTNPGDPRNGNAVMLITLMFA